MQKTVLVAGATGNLGGKIVDSLLQNGANVIVLVRQETAKEKIIALQNKGVQTAIVNNWVASEIALHCHGVDTVVSCLSGFEAVIVDAQKELLDAAISAKVKRFIPSDFSIDFTNLVDGQNRNLDFRRKFAKHVENANIEVTSIFNGAFMELLTTDMPLILGNKKRILCWGNPNQKMDFTTTYNVAAFTAKVALDNNPTPRYMPIAGDRLSCNDFITLLSQLSNKPFKLLKPGGIGLFNFLIKVTRFFAPAPKELYSAWQGMQYMRDMMEGRVATGNTFNDKYAGFNWTKVNDFLNNEKVNY